MERGRVTYGEGSLGRASYRPAMEQHLLHQNLACVLHTQGNHSQTIAHQYHVHAGMVGDMGAGKVVGRDHGNWLIFAVEALEGVDGDGLSGDGWRRAEG